MWSYTYVTGFAKRDHLGLRLDFELGIWSESTLDELSVAFYGASLAATVFEIRWLELRNYANHNMNTVCTVYTVYNMFPHHRILSVLHFRCSPYTKKMTAAVEVFGPHLRSREGLWVSNLAGK